MIDLLDLGTPDAGDGDDLRAGGGKINSNFTALDKRLNYSTSDPAAGDDSGDGYQVGSLWVNTSTGAVFICRDASMGAAAWFAIDTNHPGFATDEWWSPYDGNVGAGSTLNGTTTFFVPFVVPRRMVVSHVGAMVHSPAAVNCRLGIYLGANRRPVGAGPLASCASTSANTQNVQAALDASLTLEKGVLYFFASQQSGNLSWVGAINNMRHQNLIGSASLAAQANGGFNVGLHLEMSSTYGTWPDLTSTSPSEAIGNYGPIPHFKISDPTP
ncbi:hypothetical protein [Phenylobacterium sp.]|uniref:hypothetical protein n=1 Tax=Phenylobacterium sp. TaxID=1871053 RepID=UPI0025DA4730|nr:hypothetical protein [Phenylobacterium sp.]